MGVGSTITFIWQSYKTKANSRSILEEFRMAIGDIVDLNQRAIELAKGEDVVIDTENFLTFTSSEEIPVQLTTYRWVSNAWVANTTVSVLWKGVMAWPGKISISIENPSNNTSDLPYRFQVVYG